MIAIARMARHLTTLGRIAGIAEDLRDVAVEREPAEQADPGFAERGNDPIVSDRRGCGADHGRLLTHRLAVEADPALTLQRHHPRIGDPDPQHAVVELPCERSIDAWDHGLVDQRAVVGDDPIQPARLGLVVTVEVRRARGGSVDHAAI